MSSLIVITLQREMSVEIPTEIIYIVQYVSFDPEINKKTIFGTNDITTPRNIATRPSAPTAGKLILSP